MSFSVLLWAKVRKIYYFCNTKNRWQVIRNVLNIIFRVVAAAGAVMSAGCSATRFVPEGMYMLDKVEIETDNKSLDVSSLEPYIRQKENFKWFSVLKVPLGTYSLSGSDTTKWINKTLRRMGESPVVYDTLQTQLTCRDLCTAVGNMGYLDAKVDVRTKLKGKKKISIVYHLTAGKPFFIHSIRYDIRDDSIAAFLDRAGSYDSRLREGRLFNVNELDEERGRITSLLMDNGYYHFNKDFITFSVDSAKGSQLLDLTMHIHKYRVGNSAQDTLHPRYRIRSVNFSGGEDGGTRLRRSVLHENTWVEPGKYFSSRDLRRTYNSFGKLPAVKYTSIRFQEVPDSNMLDCNIHISTNKSNSISFQPEGTNTAGDLGAALSVTYENRNIFRGAETFSIRLRGAFEAITGLEGYQNQDYEEYSVESKLSFPRFVAPLLPASFRKNSSALSELAVSYNMQNRPEFHRRVFSSAWRYRWSNLRRTRNYKFDLIDLNYIYMPWISQTFKEEYLDNASNRNAILRYNYEDLFIMKIGFGYSYTGDNEACRVNVETAGNVLGGISRIAGFRMNDDGQYTLFNIAYAQYVKADFDYTKVIRFGASDNLALHVGVGVAYPYGNSFVLPFEKRYFSGGANSVRGWSVRGLGPGKFKGVDGAIDFINQTGDVKLDLNMEYRSLLFWKIYGAAFIDAGNIWTLRKYAEQPGGDFRIGEFYKQIAVAYGIGLRLNFDYFILRFDMGMKAINPAYDTNKEHFALLHPKFGRDSAFHFAVGLPF